MSKPNVKFRVCILVLFICITNVCAEHIKGSFKTNEFFKFLTKFGFQKTDIHSPKESYGYIFGNITSNYDFPVPITFAVLDRTLFLDYYSNRNVADKEKACKHMFRQLNVTAYDPKCDKKGQDYLRTIPCKRDQLCVDEDTPWNVIKGNQFTYVIQNLGQPRFWYISMVACYRNTTTCEWHHYNETKLAELSRGSAPFQGPHQLTYDFWVVNGNPNLSAYNTLLFQFSFDRQNTVELYLLFWVCYIILVPLQIYAVRSQRHPVTRLFTCSLLLEFIALCFIVVHTAKFAFDGIGFSALEVAGDILDILSRTLFMLLLLLLAKGWAVTRLELTWKPVVFGIWLCYGVVHILLYTWNMTEVDIIEEIDEYQTWPGWLMLAFRVLIMFWFIYFQTEVDIIEEIDEYQTWPGWLMLAFRVLIMFWFIYELRNTMLYEHNMVKLNFLLHFGASSLVWFIYLPLIALIALQISPLWRFKFLLGITYSADCMAFCVMAHLLWPTRSEQYLLLAPSTFTGLEELDEFNESPHVVHGSGDIDSLMEPDPGHPGQLAAVGPSSRDRLDGEEDRLALVADDDDDVIFTALTPQANNHKYNNVFG